MGLSNACLLLVDNGSMRPEATLQLRSLASAMTNQIGARVHPVSLQHADGIDPVELDGRSAQVFDAFMRQQLTTGQREFVVLPLFFGLSRALTTFVPRQVDELKRIYGDFELDIADVLYPLPDGEPLLADILLDHLTHTAQQHNASLTNIVLVDHGSPAPQVTQVRQELAEQLQKRLGGNTIIEQAAMERREGKAYDFNGELLGTWLITKAKQGASSAIVTLLFSLPGRHAGKGGDIELICERVMSEYPEFTIYITPLVSEHDGLRTILESRLKVI